MADVKPQHRVFAALIALVHVILAGFYAANTPFLHSGRVYFQGGGPDGVYTLDIGAPDEMQHVVQAGRIANGELFPQLEPKDPQLDFNYQAHQPPLFYLIAAGWLKTNRSVSVLNFADFASTQPKVSTQALLDKQDWKQIQSSEAQVKGQGFMFRMLNALIGGLGVLGVFCLVLWTVKNEAVAFTAAGFAALLPMNAALSGAISNDPLLICLCTWACAYLVRGARECGCWGVWLTAGVLTGLALLTKSSALALVPVWLLAILISGREMMIRSIMSFFLAIAIGGIWFAHNIQVYGDPLAMRAFNEAFTGRSPSAAQFIERLGAVRYWGAVGQLSAYSFLGVFSYMDIYLASENLYWLFIGLLALSLLGNLKREHETQNPGLWIPAVLALAVVGLFLRFNMQFYQAQARYLMPAIGPIALFVALGAYKPLQRPALTGALWAAVLLAANASALMSFPKEFAARLGPTPVKAGSPAN